VRAAALAVAAAVAATLPACRSTEPRPLVRVDAPGGDAGGAAVAAALRIARAVRAVAEEERLACVEGSGPVVITCSPGDVGSRSVQVRLTVRRAGSGVEVLADAPFAGAGDPEVCRLAARLVRAIDAELGPRSARVHGASGCPGVPDPERPATKV
jgi:hypothetical protein